MPFTHLHVHSNFSLLDGAATVQELSEAVAARGMKALALTDHNGLYGAVRFVQAARQAGIKPIIGVEFTVEAFAEGPASCGVDAAERRTGAPQQTGPSAETHLVLLAEDNEGYSNLCRLVTAARLGQAQSAGPFAEEYDAIDRAHPVLSQEHLRQHASHLIALSGCERGEIAQWLQAGRPEAAAQAAHFYRGLFGPGNFYVELQHLWLPPPDHRRRYELAALATRLGLPVVATNDVHYVDASHARLQDVLTCLRHKISVDEPHPDRKRNFEYRLKSPAEMGELFADLPEALRNTEEIAERCQWTLDLERFHFPAFDLEGLRNGVLTPTPLPRPPGSGEGNGNDNGNDLFPLPHAAEDSRSYLRRLCYAGAKWRYGEITPAVGQRLEHELRIIEAKGLCDYFLIVWDIVRFARSRGIRATGRGSAGDSILSYVLDITHADPLAHDLLFERFINPERQGMPDIDVDFCSRRRDEVTAYVYERYGAAHVAAVCTLNTFRARAAIREIGKALRLPEEELGPLAAAFPYLRASKIAEATVTLPEVRETPFDFRDKGVLLELCHQVSGYPRHLSVHVGGLVIGAEPLTNLMPLELANKGIVISAFDKDDIEALGMLKMDLLGLRIHTAIADCLELIERRTGRCLDLEALPLDDEASYRLMRSTHTIGLFQMESPGQRNLLGRTQPHEFEEVIANISLFRPGPVQSDMIRPYIARKHGLQPVTYLHPALEPVLRTSYGVLIYQEHVLQIAQAVAGFSLGQGDLLRRAMTSDRSRQEMEEIRGQFVQGAIGHGVDRFVADRIFDDIAGFAAYGFNKAHAACFARITYQTAYLKAHYPAEFLAGILSAQPMGFYPPRTIAEEAKRLGIALLPPCVNRSEAGFIVEEDGDGVLTPTPLPRRTACASGEGNGSSIRTGLRLIYGMSEGAMESILQARAEGGEFRSLRDFCRRTSVPRPLTETLILARAFAFTELAPAQLMWQLAALEGPRSNRPPSSGRLKRVPFNARLDFAETETLLESLPALDEETEFGRVGLDLHLLGLSTTSHPFKFWQPEVKRRGVTLSADLYRCRDGERVKIAGIVVARARPPTKSGRTAIFICLEDESGLIDAAIFEDCYQRHGRVIVASPVLLIEGKLSRLGQLDLSVIAQRVEALPTWEELRSARREDDRREAALIFPSNNWGQ
jgi:error-prone DNA polymerase